MRQALQQALDALKIATQYLVDCGIAPEESEDDFIAESIWKAQAALAELGQSVWHDGYPPKPYSQEWFIAKTSFGDRVVLIALPDEYSYDFKTADDTYFLKEKIVTWMQFPDSDYVPHGNYEAASKVASSPEQNSFQSRVHPWLMECFGEMIAGDREERNHRFLEEALELVQSCGCTRSEAHQLVDYVYDRPIGDKNQEVGGVMVTMAALCLANGLDMHSAAETELARIWTKVEQIRDKQAAKPKHSPFPEQVASSEVATLEPAAIVKITGQFPGTAYAYLLQDLPPGTKLFTAQPQRKPQIPQNLNTLDIELLVRRLRESDPGWCTGKNWYSRDEIVKSLLKMRYSEDIAQELADWFLLHIVNAFNRGFFNGVKKIIDKYAVPQHELLSDERAGLKSVNTELLEMVKDLLHCLDTEANERECEGQEFYPRIRQQAREWIEKVTQQ